MSLAQKKTQPDTVTDSLMLDQPWTGTLVFSSVAVILYNIYYDIDLNQMKYNIAFFFTKYLAVIFRSCKLAHQPQCTCTYI